MTDLSKIIKRDGKMQPFEEQKIVKAIAAALATASQLSQKQVHSEATRLTKIVISIVKKGINGNVPTVEQIQDVVEQVLMAAGHYEPAKAYICSTVGTFPLIPF